MEAGEEKGGWESGFFFLIFTDIVKMGWDGGTVGHSTVLYCTVTYINGQRQEIRTTPVRWAERSSITTST